MINEYKSYSLFNDVEDIELRSRNRGTIMANIVEDNDQEGNVSAKGMALLIGYFQAITEVERKDAMQVFRNFMTNRGFVNSPVVH